MTDKSTELATLGSGCFWCTEGVFQRIRGVNKVTSGYAGGHIPNPTYEQVCSGITGHTECVQLEFNTSIIPYQTILEIFFQTHDPTTLNRQGNDVGTQYRSVIFYHSQKQKQIAENVIHSFEKNNQFNFPIVTEIAEFTAFYPAESYHQNFYNQNRQHPYCQIVIDPKVKKLLSTFHSAVS